MNHHKTPLMIITESLKDNPETTLSLLLPAIAALGEDDEPVDMEEEDENEETKDDDIDYDDDGEPLTMEGDEIEIEEDTDAIAVEETVEEPVLPEVQKAIEEFFAHFDLIDQESTAGKRFIVLLKAIPNTAPLMVKWLEKYSRLSVEVIPLR